MSKRQKKRNIGNREELDRWKVKHYIQIPKIRAGYRILLYLCSVLIIAVSMYCMFTDALTKSLQVTCYAISFFALLISIYYLIGDVQRLVSFVKKLLLKNSHTKRVVSEYRYRTFVFVIPGVIGNIYYAAVNAIAGVTTHSPWLGSFAAYYILLSIMRLLALRTAGKLAKENADSEKKREAEYRIYYLYSILFFIFGWILLGFTILLYHSLGFKTYSGVTIYAIAAYTFFRTFMSIKALIKTHKEKSPLMMILRKMGYLDACVAVLILQVAMIGQFGANDNIQTVQRANACTGLVVTAIALGMGIQGIASYLKRDKI